MSKIKFPCDADRLRGHQTREWAKGVIAARRGANPDFEPNRGCNRLQSPATGIVGGTLIAGRDAVTPPLLTDTERGAGESTNARLHRLIGRYRDST